MYNKIFTKILDSSIWLETDTTRLVWLTIIASMDEDGFVQFASIKNLAHRTRVSERAAAAAVKVLEGPDSNSSDPENEGRRIERVPGGWIVLNAPKYREIVTRAVAQEKTRLRVARFRQRNVTACNAHVTASNVLVTPSEAVSEAKAVSSNPSAGPAAGAGGSPDPRHHEVTSRWSAYFLEHHTISYAFSPRDAVALKRLLSQVKDSSSEILQTAKASWERSQTDRYARACKQASTLHGLCGAYNEIRVELQSGVRDQSKRSSYA